MLEPCISNELENTDDKVKKIERYILFQIFYRFFDVNDIANAGHDSWTSDCVPEERKKGTSILTNN